MDFSFFAGEYADAVFRSVSIPYIKARYQGVEVQAPIFDKDVVPTSETSLQFMDTQNLRQFLILPTKTTFQRALNLEKQRQLQALQQKLASGLITTPEFEQQSNLIQRIYSPLYAIAPNQLWEIYEQEWGMWQNCKVVGEGKINRVRYEITLVKLPPN
jgi:hypothetical protein